MIHNLIKEKLINLIEWTFKREGSPYITCYERQAFLTSGDTKRYKLWSCQNVCEALIYLLDNIYIRFGTKLYRKIVGIPMGTNCVPFVADLFLFSYARDFLTFSCFPFGFEGRMWDLIVSDPDYCLSFYFASVFEEEANLTPKGDDSGQTGCMPRLIESLLGAHVILLVLSCYGSVIIRL